MNQESRVTCFSQKFKTEEAKDKMVKNSSKIVFSSHRQLDVIITRNPRDLHHSSYVFPWFFQEPVLLHIVSRKTISYMYTKVNGKKTSQVTTNDS